MRFPRLLLVAFLSSHPGLLESQLTEWRGGVTHVDTVPAPSLRGNLMGDPDWREATVYLPPGYRKNPRKRYPVVYLLHGFDADHRVFIRGPYQNMNVRISMDSLIGAGAVRDMIVVTPSARNFFQGSFYVNSPVSGRWEDFIVRDLVSHMDRQYRTIRAREGRGISGHSMGGYGALHISMRHPETFSAVYAMSPCCLDRMDREERIAGWKAAIGVRDSTDYRRAGFTANLLYALSVTYSPNLAKPPFFADLPYRLEGETLVADSVVLSKWVGPLAMAPAYLSNFRRLSIGFDVGDEDAGRDIPANVRALDSLLAANDIPHFAEVYSGNHGSRVRARLETIVFPFFSRVLR